MYLTLAFVLYRHTFTWHAFAYIIKALFDLDFRRGNPGSRNNTTQHALCKSVSCHKRTIYICVMRRLPVRTPPHSPRQTRATETGKRSAAPPPWSTTPSQRHSLRTGGRFVRVRCTALARLPSRTHASRPTTPTLRQRWRVSCCSCCWSHSPTQPGLGLKRYPKADGCAVHVCFYRA